MSPASNVPIYKAQCKATFVGICSIPGSISENHVLASARDLIRSCSDYLPWTVSVEDGDLRMVLGKETTSDKEGSSSDEDQASDTSSASSDHSALHLGLNQVALSRVLFCYIDAQYPNVISWVLTKNYAAGNNKPVNLNNGCLDKASVKNAINAAGESNVNHFYRAETEALVWECQDERDAAALQEAYKNIRSRKKLNKIEALAKQQLNVQQKRQVQLLQTCESNASEHVDVKCEKTRLTAVSQNNGAAPGNKHLLGSALGDKLSANERLVLAERLERSNKPNADREVLVAAQFDSRHHLTNQRHVRQRHPALLLQPIKPGNGQGAMQQRTTIQVTAAPATANYWVNSFPSESEFDPTRIGRYFNYSNRGYQGQRRQYSRSKSVDASLSRLSIAPAAPTKSSANHKVLKATFASNNANRTLIVTRSESLNSDGSSLSGDNDSDLRLQHALLSHCDPPKSALKKCGSNSSTSSPPSQPSALSQSSHYLNSKKNVTFSAFATIQVMDK